MFLEASLPHIKDICVCIRYALNKAFWILVCFNLLFLVFSFVRKYKNRFQPNEWQYQIRVYRMPWLWILIFCYNTTNFEMLFFGLRSNDTANKFNVIFTLFMGVPLSIPLYSLHLIAAPSEKYKHWFTVVYCNIYTSAL